MNGAAWTRAFLAWGVLLILAIVNGAFREGVLVPRMGLLRAHQVSTLLLAALILGASRGLSGWLAIPEPRAALKAGALWVALLLVFEFGAGHFLFGRPWSSLFAEYDVTAGRLWILIPFVTFAAPWVWLSPR